MLSPKIVLLCALLSVSVNALGRKQAAAVKGKLTCDGRPASNIKVKLYDDDSGLDTDDFMASGKTDKQGNFQIEGTASEFLTIDPKLNIYHDCNDGIKPCQRKVTIKIPSSYVSNGSKAKKVYDAGHMELAGKFPGEKRSCIH